MWRISVASFSFGMLGQKRVDEGLVADHQEADAGMTLESQSRARNDDGRTMVAAHRVERECELASAWRAFLPFGEQAAENSGLRGRRN